MSDLPENWPKLLDAAVLKSTGVEVETILDITAGQFGLMVTTPKDRETPLTDNVHVVIRAFMEGMRA